jgi:hypothetical protein
MQEVGTYGAELALLTGVQIDSGIDSQQCIRNKKAHRIMGLIVVTGGPEEIPTKNPYAINIDLPHMAWYLEIRIAIRYNQS